ncbi:L-fuconolactone hydrolase [Acidisarcina polymorpha]|uniref:L-fuconolactone hydrolase n=1 Tax=Acidisarcina polymorpha TaxID=2211140 RepID=A0A2Z5G256_9BACT|nr:amidohydrolase family protein [Acidisarcina polymorpha]AXC13253.1 L-fuconolactone hydrolase [Acidisarcina polymorpha]
MRKLLIDAHQHFWKYDPLEYGWIDETLSALRYDFLPENLLPDLGAAGVGGTVAVQARQTLEETDWLLQLAKEHAFIYGVVGWAPIADRVDFPRQLERLSHASKLKGLRHVVQGEPDGFLADSDFNAGIAALQPSGLVYDILIVERQLPEAIAFVDRHPNQIFVLDHLAKPLIAKGELSPWSSNIMELARRENVFCKISGIVTEANWGSWTAETLAPYIDIVLRAFSPRRVMVGSDWPVCTVASSYAKWFATLHRLLEDLSDSERERILNGTALEVYRIQEDNRFDKTHHLEGAR